MKGGVIIKVTAYRIGTMDIPTAKIWEQEYYVPTADTEEFFQTKCKDTKDFKYDIEVGRYVTRRPHNVPHWTW